MFADILANTKPPINEAADTAAKANMPQKTTDAIFTGINQRARLINA